MARQDLQKSVSASAIPHGLFSEEYKGYEVQVPSGAKLFFVRRTSTASAAHCLVLLHGFPQNHSLWYQFVKHLPAKGLDIIMPDLPGYGKSTKEPSKDGSSRNHSKREMAKDILALVDVLRGPNERFVVYGHDRGARVAYRMALDHPQRLIGMAALDIVPGVEQFRAMHIDNKIHGETLGSYHWLFLAQPSPLPDNLIAAAPEFYITSSIERWSGSRFRGGKYEKEAMASWVDPYVQSKAVIIGACEDYRAGAHIDLETELNDKTKVSIPALILYSASLARHPVQAIRGTSKEVISIRYLLRFAASIEALDDVVKETLPWFKELGLEVQ